MDALIFDTAGGPGRVRDIPAPALEILILSRFDCTGRGKRFGGVWRHRFYRRRGEMLEYDYFAEASSRCLEHVPNVPGVKWWPDRRHGKQREG